MRRAKSALESLAVLALIAAAAPAARADYAVLRSGVRLHITGYERRGATYVLQFPGGQAVVPASEIVGFEPEDTFQPAARQTLPTPYSGLIARAAERHGVDERLVAGVIAAESNFKPRAVSPKGAQGLMQLMPRTAARLAVRDAFDPAQNIEAGTRYLSGLLGAFHKNVTLALAAYNAGPERVVAYGGVPPFPETRAYIARVRRVAAKLAPARSPAGDRAMLCPPNAGACRETFSEAPAASLLAPFPSQ
jgi:hypothetical protein